MATTQRTRTSTKKRNEKVGLLANGASAPWDLAIDEAIAGGDRWYAQIEGPAISFYFEIPSLDIVGRMARFLESATSGTEESAGTSAKRNESILIGKDKGIPVTLVKDDEYKDRFFLVVGQPDRPIVRFVLAGADAAKISEALRQVEEELEEAS